MFQFRLASVLNYRRQIEDIRRQEFAKTKKEWETEKEKLERYYERWRKCLDAWRKKQEDAIDVNELGLYQRYMLTLREEIRLQAERVKQCVLIMDRTREILLNAQKERKMMDKLKDYHVVEYKKDERRKETNFLDEVATLRFNLKGYK